MRVGRLPVVVTVTLDDGSMEVTPDDDRPYDRIVFERRYGRTWPPLKEHPNEVDEDGDPRITLDTDDDMFLFMAWVQIHRQDIASKALKYDDFDLWCVRIVEVEMDFQTPADTESAEDGVSVPTVPAPSSGV